MREARSEGRVALQIARKSAYWEIKGRNRGVGRLTAVSEIGLLIRLIVGKSNITVAFESAESKEPEMSLRAYG